MAKMKRVKKPENIQKKVKSVKPRQGHKLVWLTLIIIAIPVAMIGFVLLTSMGGQNKPVVGNRYSKSDLNPEISNEMLSQMEQNLGTIDNVEGVSINLKSATVRVLLDLNDDADSETAENAAQAAYDEIDSLCPVSEYFTNKEKSKMYDLEINAYNYLVDDMHTQDGQVYIQLTKTGAGNKVVDNMNEAKNQELVDQIQR